MPFTIKSLFLIEEQSNHKADKYVKAYSRKKSENFRPRKRLHLDVKENGNRHCK